MLGDRTRGQAQHALIKRLTGQDTNKIRTLFGKCMGMVFRGLLLTTSNQLVNLSHVDHSVSDRLRMLKFEYSFRANPSMDEGSNERKAIPGLAEKFALPRFRDEFMRMLLDIFAENFVHDGEINTDLTFPHSVIDDSNDPSDPSDQKKKFMIICRFFQKKLVIWRFSNFPIFFGISDDLYRLFFWSLGSLASLESRGFPSERRKNPCYRQRCLNQFTDHFRCHG